MCNRIVQDGRVIRPVWSASTSSFCLLPSHFPKLPAPAALEALLLPQPPGKAYRLLKILTQPAASVQIAKLGSDRAPVVMSGDSD